MTQMIVRDSAGQTYQVVETNDPALAHCWNGIAVKLTKTAVGFEPKKNAKPILVRKIGCEIITRW
jgi:hypothetical protein